MAPIIESEIVRHYRWLKRHSRMWGIARVYRISQDVHAQAELRIAADRVLSQHE